MRSEEDLGDSTNSYSSTLDNNSEVVNMVADTVKSVIGIS